MGASKEQLASLDTGDFKTKATELFETLKEKGGMFRMPTITGFKDTLMNKSPDMVKNQLKKMGASKEQLDSLNSGNFKEKAAEIFQSLKAKSGGVRMPTLTGFKDFLGGSPNFVKSQLEKMGASKEQLASLDTGDFKTKATELFKTLREKAGGRIPDIAAFKNQLSSLSPEDVKAKLASLGCPKEKIAELDPKSANFKEKALALLSSANFSRATTFYQTSTSKLSPDIVKGQLRALGASQEQLSKIDFSLSNWKEHALKLMKDLRRKEDFVEDDEPLAATSTSPMGRRFSESDPQTVLSQLRSNGATEDELKELDPEDEAFEYEARALMDTISERKLKESLPPELRELPPAIVLKDKDDFRERLNLWGIPEEDISELEREESPDAYEIRFQNAVQKVAAEITTPALSPDDEKTQQSPEVQAALKSAEQAGITDLMDNMADLKLGEPAMNNYVGRALKVAILDPEAFKVRKDNLKTLMGKARHMSRKSMNFAIDAILPPAPELEISGGTGFSFMEYVPFDVDVERIQGLQAKAELLKARIAIPIGDLTDPTKMTQIFSDLLMGLAGDITSSKEMLMDRFVKEAGHSAQEDMGHLFDVLEEKEGGPDGVDKSKVKKMAGDFFNSYAKKLRITSVFNDKTLQSYREVFQTLLMESVDKVKPGKKITAEDFKKINLKEVMLQLKNRVANEKAVEVKIDQTEMSNFAMLHLAQELSKKFALPHVTVLTNDDILNGVETAVDAFIEKLDGKVPAEKRQACIQAVTDAVLENVDKDGSGDVDEDEWQDFLNKVKAMNRKHKIDLGTLMEVMDLEKVMEEWEEVDDDNSGSLDHEELTNLIFKLAVKWNEECMEGRINLSKDSLMIQEMCKAVIHAIDRDNDGEVDREEFQLFFERVEQIKDLTNDFSDDQNMLAGLLEQKILETVWHRFDDGDKRGLNVSRLGEFLMECISMYGQEQDDPVEIDIEGDHRLLASYIETLEEVVQNVINEDRDEWITMDEMLAFHEKLNEWATKARSMPTEKMIDMLVDAAMDEVWKEYDEDGNGKVDQRELFNMVSDLIKKATHTHEDPPRHRVEGLRDMLLRMSDENQDGWIDREEFELVKECIQRLRGAGAKLKNVERRVDLNKLCEKFKNANLDRLWDKYDLDGNGVLDKEEMTTFFKQVVKDLSGTSKGKKLTSEAIANAADELLGIAFVNLKKDHMLPQDFKHFADWFQQSLQFVSTDDMMFVKSMLKNKSLPKNVMYILQNIANKKREIPPEQMAFVQEIISDAKMARKKSRRGDMTEMFELQEQTRKLLNKEIAKSLPKGEVADLFSSMAGDEMDEDMKELNREMQEMLGDDPMSTLGSLSPEKAAELEKKMKAKAMTKMTEMMVDNFIPGGGGAGIKAALGNANKSMEMAEKIRAAISKKLGQEITLQDLKAMTKKGEIDEEKQKLIDEAIHEVIDGELEGQKGEITSKLVKVSVGRLRGVKSLNVFKNPLEFIIGRFVWIWLFIKMRLICAGALVGGAILFPLGVAMTILFGILNLVTCAKIEELILLWLAGLVGTDLGIALLLGGMFGIISPNAGFSSIGIHSIETLFVDVTGPYARMLIFLDTRGQIKLEDVLEIIFGFIVGIVIGQLKSMNMMEILHKVEEEEDEEAKEGEEGEVDSPDDEKKEELGNSSSDLNPDRRGSHVVVFEDGGAGSSRMSLQGSTSNLATVEEEAGGGTKTEVKKRRFPGKNISIPSRGREADEQRSPSLVEMQKVDRPSAEVV